MEDFLLKRYQDYLAIQFAWMEFKYDMLSEKTTNELYNQYQMQLETLKTKGQKNVMKDFLYVDGMITSVSKVNNQTTVTVEIVTKFYDYIINEKNQVIIRFCLSTKIIIIILIRIRFWKQLMFYFQCINYIVFC